jgi:hypothetical protein
MIDNPTLIKILKSEMKKITGYSAGKKCKKNTKSARTIYKCKWLTCAYGLGLAGRGICSAYGKWGIKNCGEYEHDEDWQIRTEYQDKNRIYLDEYPEQEKLRSEYFRDKDYWRIIKEAVHQANIDREILFQNLEYKKEKDIFQHFWNRFMERK